MGWGIAAVYVGQQTWGKSPRTISPSALAALRKKTDCYKAWVSRMLATGEYTPGIYTHQHNAQQVFEDVSAIFQAAGRTEMPRFWIAGGKGFDEGRAPQDVGYAFAGVWQGVIDVARSVATIKLPVDVNVAKWASPSESGVNVQ
jgi:hypothetical protein